MRLLSLPLVVGICLSLATAGTLRKDSPVKPAFHSTTQPLLTELVLPLGDKVSMKLALLPAGEFSLASEDNEKRLDFDRHQVKITRPFYMGIYPVTQQEYDSVMGINPCKFKGPTNPVDQVSWYDAMAFCAKMSAKTGRVVRLPTEAQWEYACRAGVKTMYYFGDDASNLDDYAWYGKNSGGKTHPVGLKKPNAFGLYDMHGNIWEWCSDRWQETFCDEQSTDPQGPPVGTRHALRGSAFYHDLPGDNIIAARVGRFPAYKPCYFGFRVIVESGETLRARQDVSVATQPAAAVWMNPATRPALRAADTLPKEITLHLTGGVLLKMALIPAGKFAMGSPKSEENRSWKEESPQHQVIITRPFYLGITEVTQGQYKAVTGINPSRFKEAKRPVECVSWNDAVRFCKRLSQVSGKAIRLPTEAEWEYACRGGTTTPYSFGHETKDLQNYAWCYYNAKIETHPVGQKKPNPFGLYDMHGNVWEWCSDWFAESYANATVTDPGGPQSGLDRTIRGGAWNCEAERGANSLRSAARDGGPPDAKCSYVGFRVAYDIVP